MKHIRFISILLATLACSIAHAEQAKILFKENIKSNFDRGRAVISITDPVLVRGEKFQLDVRFISEGMGGTFFNVFLVSPSPYLPASLAMFDEKKNYVGDLLDIRQGSSVPGQWISIPSGAYVGTTVNLRAGVFGGRAVPLPVGTYYLQMIYNPYFITPRPSNLKAWLEFYKDFEEGELFRSNVLQIELVDKKPAK